MKYEYRTRLFTFIDDQIQGELNAIAADGWRLVQIINNLAIFERLIDPKKKK